MLLNLHIIFRQLNHKLLERDLATARLITLQEAILQHLQSVQVQVRLAQIRLNPRLVR